VVRTEAALNVADAVEDDWVRSKPRTMSSMDCVREEDGELEVLMGQGGKKDTMVLVVYAQHAVLAPGCSSFTSEPRRSVDPGLRRSTAGLSACLPSLQSSLP